MTDKILDYSLLSGLAPELAQMLASIASDVVLVLDQSGVIHRVASNGSEPMRTVADAWLGRPWSDTVTGETRHKVEELLRDAQTQGISRQRQVNHMTAFGLDLPVNYTAIRLGLDGPVLAVGRDLRGIAAAQQRLLATQKEIERDYWKLRQTETRYRLLFQIATDAILVIHADSHRVIEANRSAARLFNESIEELVGRPATAGLTRPSIDLLNLLLADVRATGRAMETTVTLANGLDQSRVKATLWQADDGDCILLKFRHDFPLSDQERHSTHLLSLARQTPDGIVITDTNGSIVTVNSAFLELAELGSTAQAEGQWLGTWIGRPGTDMQTLLDSIKSSRMLKHVDTALRSERGHSKDIVMSAALISLPDDEHIGFIIRERGEYSGRAPSHEVH